MTSGLLSLFAPNERPVTLAEYLERSAYDELVEIDLVNDRCRNIYHVEGKYFVPVTDNSFTEMFKYAAEHMIYPDDRETFEQLLDPATLSKRLAESDTPGAISNRMRYKLQNGDWRWTEVCVIGDGRHELPKGLVHFYVFDVDNQISREIIGMSGTHLVPEDAYSERTGLLLEQPFREMAPSILQNKAPHPWCLIAIDLDHFKLFNEWYGREKGDLIIAEIGSRIAEEAEATDGLGGYHGGDDFRLITPYDRPRIEKLFDDIGNLVANYGADVGFMPVFGISIVENHIPIHELIDQAVMAVNNAKTDFRKRICLFKPHMHEQEEKEYRILSNFLHGLEVGEIFFQLQPQCRLSTGKIVGAEALARWRRPDGTIISPTEFVPILERHGFITRLDSFIWEGTCAWIRSWIDRGHAIVPISVNVSQVDFYVIDVVNHFKELIEKYDLTPQHIKIEVTESAYVNNATVVADATSRLRDTGFLVLMDDFGSGYSSLNTLRNLNLDVIKLDAQLIDIEKGEDRKGVHILESVINMAKSLSMPMISEGVETPVQSAFLEGQGCHYVQGFLYYRPLDIDQFEEVISDERIIDEAGFVVEQSEQFRTSELFDKHVYNESMLNTILGAVALFSWHGDSIDIVRFNSEFQMLVNSRNLYEYLGGIQDLMLPHDRPKLYTLLAAAEENRLTGSRGVMRFQRADGSLNRYLCYFYYLGAKDESKRFYVSIRDVTELTRLQGQMKLISRFSSDTIIFARKRKDGRHYSVVVHGLEDVTGLSMEELQEELDSTRFFERIDEGFVQDVVEAVTGNKGKSTSMRFRMTNARDERIELALKIDIVDDESSDVTAILEVRND